MKFLRLAAAWLVAALVTGLASSVMSSQQVLAGLTEIGAVVSIADRAQMTLFDLRILETLMPVLCACFLVGFLVAAACYSKLGGRRQWWYIVAGGSSFLTTILLLSWQLNLMPIAGARTPMGLALMTACGALGGLVFAQLSKDKTEQQAVDHA